MTIVFTGKDKIRYLLPNHIIKGSWKGKLELSSNILHTVKKNIVEKDVLLFVC